jgi:hypothetical protein
MPKDFDDKIMVFHRFVIGLVITNRQCVVGFEVLTAVVMKGTIFWDITPCSPLSVN